MGRKSSKRFLESNHSNHYGQLYGGRYTGAEGEDPPVEGTVPQVQHHVGQRHRGRGVTADGDQRLGGRTFEL